MSHDSVQEQQTVSFDTTVNRLIDLTIGRFSIASADPRNVAPFMAQCRRDLSDLLGHLVAALKQENVILPSAASNASASASAAMATFVTASERANASKVLDASVPPPRPSSARVDAVGGGMSTTRPGSARSSSVNMMAQQQQQHGDVHGGDGSGYGGGGGAGSDASASSSSAEVVAEQLHKQLLMSQSNESAWKDMCSEVVEELEQNQGKTNELQGQLVRREALLKEMRVAYFTEITHLREMVRQFRQKGSCSLPDVSIFNWKDDGMADQLLMEQKQKSAQALEDERLRHQRELDIAYERYMKMNEHLRAQLNVAERENKLLRKEKQQSGGGGGVAEDDEKTTTSSARAAHRAAEMSPLRSVGRSVEVQTEDALGGGAASASSLGQILMPRSPSDVDVASTSALLVASGGGGGARPDSQAGGKSPSNFPLSRLASTFEKENNNATTTTAMMDRDGGTLSVPLPSYPPTPQPLDLPSPTTETIKKPTSARSGKGGEGKKGTPSSLTTATGKGGGSKPNTSKTATPRGKRPGSAKPATATAKVPAFPPPSPSPTPPHQHASEEEHQQQPAGSTSSSSSPIPPKPKISSDSTTPRNSSRQQQHQQQHHQPRLDHVQSKVAAATAAVSEKTITTLMESHKRQLEAVRAEKDAATTKYTATKEQLAQALKKMDHLVADAVDREEEIVELKKKLEDQPTRSAIDIKATNLKLREELIRKNQLLETRTKDLVQLQEETARWFEAFRSIHPADRSPINYAVLERLAAAVQKAEKAEEKYRISTWSLLTMQLQHKQIMEAVKGEISQLHGKRDADSMARTRKLQKQSELVFSRLWRAAAKHRHFRAKCKTEANVCWDIVLFTARALVNHEDIAVVNEFFVLSSEAVEGKPPTTTVAVKQQETNNKPSGDAEDNKEQQQHQQAQEQQQAKTTTKPSSASSRPQSAKNKEVTLLVAGDDGEKQRRNISPPTTTQLVGQLGIAEHPVSSSRARLLRKPVRPASAASTVSTSSHHHQLQLQQQRPQTPISATSDLRCVPMSSIPTHQPFLAARSFRNHHRSVQAALKRRQQMEDLETKQRNIDEVRMRTLRYYSNRAASSAAVGSSSSPAATATTRGGGGEVGVVPGTDDHPFSPVNDCLHRAKLFGRNEAI